MTLALSGADIARFEEAAETLISPSAYPDAAAWCTAVMERVEALLGADRSMLMLPLRGEFHSYSDSISPDGVRALHAPLMKPRPGSTRAARAGLDSVLRHRRAAALDVWSSEVMARNAGVPPSSIPFYNEVLVPNGVANAAGIVAPLPLGEAWLNIAHSPRAHDRFGTDGKMHLLRMLLPAFRAGVRRLVGLENGRPMLPTAADLRERYGLTRRESEVALLYATGASDAAVARQLHISPHTVRTHAERLYRKLDIHSRKALALRFLSDGSA